MNLSRLPAVLPATALTVVIDNREQLPFTLKVNTPEGPVQIPTVRGTLATGDYSLLGFEDEISVERKSLEDLIGCIGNGRKRFDAECIRLLAYRTRCIVVEASWTQLQLGHWRSQVTVNAAVGSVVGWEEMGISIVFPGNRHEADLYTARFLYTAARRRYRRLREGFTIQGGTDDKAG